MLRTLALASRTELSDFLAAVERRAYKQALFACRDDQAALDAVQEAMMKLAEKYAARPAAELPLLFQRILQNAIRDHFRRQKVRSGWISLLSSLVAEDEAESDALDRLASHRDSAPGGPQESLEQAQSLAIIEQEIGKLPARQRQAFLLRYWEEMDISETAQVMGCSEGSVKTHCSRAAHALAAALEAKGIIL